MERFETMTARECASVYGGTGSFWIKLLKFLLKFGDSLLEGILEGWEEAKKNGQTSLTF